ncbi:protein COBRA-like [Nicotiana sylvestris]|uniref:Protein COBRA-like n=1 Tax=Nicotiana sylvestris TaxID=4096 RepID=A0A1U7YKG3_NICSY|nr:PREDICTED: protein COBRA-like [Nicotiana sylvestris]XP_009804567.1 PREDICTED: protein COBRA-like [Nicotiana sylvestris]
MAVFRSLSVTTFRILLLAFLLSLLCFTSTDARNQNGNITIKWDIMSWTPNVYTVNVSIYNFEKYRPIQAPRWQLGWKWSDGEVIWSARGGQATERGDCSQFKGNIPYCCKRDPTFVYKQRLMNCRKGAVINSWVQDPWKAVSSFELDVGHAFPSIRKVRKPKRFTLKAPGYYCRGAKTVESSKFPTQNGTIAKVLKTWSVTCMYSRFVAEDSSISARYIPFRLPDLRRWLSK